MKKYSINGDVEDLSVDICNNVIVTGNVNKVDTTSGDVEVKGNVSNGIKTTSGDIEISGDVTGDINTTSGDVRAKNITGKVRTTSGDIKH